MPSHAPVAAVSRRDRLVISACLAVTIAPVRMGLRHGVFCLGCCWALMCVLFAVGIMNLAWVAALTLLVFLEKAGPQGMIIARAGGVLLVCFGSLRALSI